MHSIGYKTSSINSFYPVSQGKYPHYMLTGLLNDLHKYIGYIILYTSIITSLQNSSQ